MRVKNAQYYNSQRFTISAFELCIRTVSLQPLDLPTTNIYYDIVAQRILQFYESVNKKKGKVVYDQEPPSGESTTI